MSVIIAKNQTAGALALSQIPVPDNEIPASGQVTLTDFASMAEIQEDAELSAHIAAGDAILNIDGSDLSAADSTAFAAPPSTEVFTATARGLVPSSGGGTANFLRADGAFAAPGGGGGGGQTDTVVGSGGITNVGTNVDADMAPTYGSAASTICQGNDARLSDARVPTGPAGGDLAGTYSAPSVAAITETSGPTSLTIGAIADGEALRRSGATVIGYTPIIACCPFGAKSDSLGKFLIANGKSSDGDDSSKPKTRQAIAHDGTLIRLTYKTKEGTTSTVMKVHIDGVVVATVTLASLNAEFAGVETISVAVTAGQYVEIEYDASDKPGECTMYFLQELTL